MISLIFKSNFVAELNFWMKVDVGVITNFEHSEL